MSSVVLAWGAQDAGAGRPGRPAHHGLAQRAGGVRPRGGGTPVVGGRGEWWVSGSPTAGHGGFLDLPNLSRPGLSVSWG
jgi:hypothetical protein